MLLSEYTDKWRGSILQLKKPATIVTMNSHIRKLNASFPETELSDLTESRFQGHVCELAKTLSPKGLKNYVGTVKLVLNRARKEGLIQAVPDPELTKLVKKPQPWLTAAEMRKLVDISEGQYKVLFYLLAETGMRIGEALGLQWQDIDFENRKLLIQRSLFSGKTQEPKTSNSIRSLSTSRRLCDTFSVHRRQRTVLQGNILRDSFIFRTNKGSSLHANSVLVSALHPCMRNSGLSVGGFHSFRRGNSTIMANLCIPETVAAARLGHGLPGLTFGLYAQTGKDYDRPYVEKIAGELA